MNDEEKEEVKPEVKPKPKLKPKLAHARLIASSGESVLVEWNDGGWKRGYIPISEFDFERALANELALKAAIPYGVDWSKAKVEIDTKALDQELKRNGFWTVEDLQSNPQLVNIILMRTAGLGREALKGLKEE